MVGKIGDLYILVRTDIRITLSITIPIERDSIFQDIRTKSKNSGVTIQTYHPHIYQDGYYGSFQI